MQRGRGKQLSTESMGAVDQKSLSSAMNANMTGSGEITLVLSHGYGGDQSIWDSILPDLAQLCRVVAFDWNFSGAADQSILTYDPSRYSSYEAFSDDLVSLIDEMDLKGVIFVGHSMAGMVGCIASVKRPDLFRRLVLLGASPRYLNSEDYQGGFERSAVESILSDIESNFQSWARGFAALVVGEDDPKSVEKFAGSLQRMRPEVALALAKTIFLSDLRGVLEQVEVPCTIIHGRSDVVAPMPVAHYMQGHIRGDVSLEIIDCYGHFPQLTATQSVLHALKGVLSSEADRMTPVDGPGVFGDGRHREE